MTTNHSDVIIAGAGIVGLATAYQIKRLRPDWKVHLLEKESALAQHQTGRNSGVVHTGVYYKPGSLKAKNCIEGRKELLNFCDEHRVPYRKIHKLIVATKEEELPRLEEIFKRGQTNGVPGLRIISKAEVGEIEPNVNALKALFVPECHIIDYVKVAEVLGNWIRTNGGKITFREPVIKVEQMAHECMVAGKNQSRCCRFFINCTGLYSDRIARASQHLVSHQILPFRGEYYELCKEKRELVQGLIYPVPDPKFPFLGVHLTPMINGKVEAGPNAILAFAREGYRKNDFNWKDMKELLSFPGFWKMAARYWKIGTYELARSYSKRIFLRDLQRLVPCIQEKDLTSGGSGIRAQVVTKEGKMLDDFALFQERNCLHVLNAPSPAATASFAIGRMIAEMALKTGIS